MPDTTPSSLPGLDALESHITRAVSPATTSLANHLADSLDEHEATTSLADVASHALGKGLVQAGVSQATDLVTSRLLGASVLGPVSMTGTAAGAAHHVFCPEDTAKEGFICKALGGIEKGAEDVNDALTWPVRHSVNWAVEQFSGHEGAKPESPVGRVVAAHLTKEGLPTSQAEALSAAIEPALSDKLGDHERDGQAVLTVHAQGPNLVTLDSNPPATDHPTVALSLDTLKDVHEAGLPEQGLATLRDGLGAEASQASDYELMHHFGHDVVTAIGMQGYPHAEVRAAKEHLGKGLEEVVPDSQVLHALGQAAREGSVGNTTLALDLGDKGVVTVGDTASLRAAAGLSPERGAQNPTERGEDMAR